MHATKTILVPTDFSPHSQAALARGCELAVSLGSALRLVHVSAGVLTEGKRSESLEQLVRSLSPHSQLKIDTRYEVLEGAVHRQIVDYATRNGVDLIVMGTHGRSGLAHFALGSVAERVLRSSPCPVLVVKSADDAAKNDADAEPDFVETSSDSVAVDLIRRALALRATDVHIDPCTDDQVVIRMRIDGRLEEYCRLEARLAEQLQNQLVLGANLDIAEPFRPKEGRVRLPSGLTHFEARITTCPVAGGQAVVLRLFSQENVFRPLASLGFTPQSLQSVQEMLRAGEGIILVTGPTAAGKTSTVYSMLQTVCGEDRNVVSIEDPVECLAPFVRQMNVDEKHGVTMVSGLRTLLRMDPDVVFVGEIRDANSAEIAMRAASSGKHVFSTLHTRDVAATITALRDLHIDNRSLAGNLAGILNQRLMRRLCTHCRRSVPLTDACAATFRQHAVDPPQTLFVADGCDLCRGAGFHGRIGVFEVALATENLKEAIAEGTTEDKIRNMIRSAGAVSLTSDALGKVAEGITTFQEGIAMRWL